MKQTSSFPGRAALVTRAAAFFLTASSISLLTALPQAAHAQGTVEALLYSTMPSTSAHQPTMAMDGDDKTYFRTTGGMSGGDDFLVLLSAPIPVRSIKIVTGDADGQDILANAVVDTSPDGVTFAESAPFDATGVASANLGGKPVQALKIHTTRRRGGASALVIREIVVDSATKISHVQMGPGRGWADISAAPEVAAWAARAEKQMEAFWPDTAALLYTDGIVTPNMVNVVYRTGPGVTAVAATGGGVMTVNTAWCKAHDDDTGLTVHEMAHVVQSGPNQPGWLVEGTADYIRWIKFEPQNYKTRLNPATATYHDSYRTTASFLAWCELHYDSKLVTKLNAATRYHRFKITMFKDYCGKDVDTLWSEFIAAYKADPVNIITPPVPPSERPRKLPAVKAGSGVSIDLAHFFDSPGIAKDGASTGTGLDGEGFAYSATLLGTQQTIHEVPFKLGAAGGNNAITAKGNTIPLPAGSYSGLWFLGTGIEGDQADQPITIDYTDGSKETVTQSFSDWYEPQRHPGESRGVQMAYRLSGDGSKDERTFFVYWYGFNLDPTKTVKDVKLPDNQNVKILAITLTN